MPAMKQISEKQLAANRANAQRSTGPRTAEGKARSARNRTGHALTAAHAILPGEDAAAFDRLKTELVAEFQPQTETESHLIDEIAQHQWKLLRAERMELRALARSFEQNSSGQNEPIFTDEIARLSRYQGSIRRAWSNAHTRLRQLQNDRRRLEASHLNQALDTAACHESNPFFRARPESPATLTPSPQQADNPGAPRSGGGGGGGGNSASLSQPPSQPEPEPEPLNQNLEVQPDL